MSDNSMDAENVIKPVNGSIGKYVCGRSEEKFIVLFSCNALTLQINSVAINFPEV